VPKDKCDADKDSNKCFANAVCRTSPTTIAGPATCAGAVRDRAAGQQDQARRRQGLQSRPASGSKQGQKYVIKVTPDGDWTSNCLPASTRGVYLSELESRWEKIKAVALWPFTRNYSKSRFAVLARIGRRRQRRIFLEPDPIPGRQGMDVEITPRRSGELFLYINERVHRRAVVLVGFLLPGQQGHRDA